MEISYQKGPIQNDSIHDKISVVNQPFKKENEQNYNSTGSQLTEDTDEESESNSHYMQFTDIEEQNSCCCDCREWDWEYIKAEVR